MKSQITAFAPGCALMLYKPELAQKTHEFLIETLWEMELHLTCCHHEPPFSEKTNIINICPGCDNLIDLLFNQETEQKTPDPDTWHKELDDFIAEH